MIATTGSAMAATIAIEAFRPVMGMDGPGARVFDSRCRWPDGIAAHHSWIRMKKPVIACAALSLIVSAHAAAPGYVDMTWFSISNMYYEIGPLKIVTDGYVTRIPQAAFSGGGGGLANTHQPFKPDEAAVTRVMNAFGGPSSVNLLLTGHSHFDHSFDTAVWSRLTGARIIGPRTTCLQAEAQQIPRGRCQAIDGGERLSLGDGVSMRVVRWNHSGTSATNPEQHDPVELDDVPTPDSSGAMRAGVAEDFPNGGGNRAFLFVVDAPGGRIAWFFQNSASADDLDTPIVVGGRNFGAPLENLKAALAAEGLTSVDLWIGTGGAEVAQLVLPVLKPRAYLPVHWDGLFGAFEADVPRPYADARLEALLARASVKLVKPAHYMDKWRLDQSGIREIPNESVKRALGFRKP